MFSIDVSQAQGADLAHVQASRRQSEPDDQTKVCRHRFSELARFSHGQRSLVSGIQITTGRIYPAWIGGENRLSVAQSVGHRGVEHVAKHHRRTPQPVRGHRCLCRVEPSVDIRLPDVKQLTVAEGLVQIPDGGFMRAHCQWAQLLAPAVAQLPAIPVAVFAEGQAIGILVDQLPFRPLRRRNPCAFACPILFDQLPLLVQPAFGVGLPIRREVSLHFDGVVERAPVPGLPGGENALGVMPCHQRPEGTLRFVAHVIPPRMSDIDECGSAGRIVPAPKSEETRCWRAASVGSTATGTRCITMTEPGCGAWLRQSRHTSESLLSHFPHRSQTRCQQHRQGHPGSHVNPRLDA